MDKKTPRPMTPFDEWTVPGELHTLKLLLPYIPAASQQAFGILIRVMELQHTTRYFQEQQHFLHSQEISGFSSPMDMLEEISPYLPPEQAGMMDTFRNMMNIMDMVQMMQAFSDENGNAFAGFGGPDSSADPGDAGSEGVSDNTDGSGSGISDSPDISGGGISDSLDGSGGGFDPMQLMMGMLSPEQREMFEMYQTMFSQNEEPAPPEPEE